MNHVVIHEHTDAWVKSFQSEETYLRGVFTRCDPLIEHVGSTSLGLAAKPIVDIAIGLESLDFITRVDFKKLAQNKWFRIKKVFKDEVVLAKYTDDSYETKSHYAHVVVTGTKRWREMIVFRDRLLKNEELKAEYLSLKLRLATEYPHDIDAYTDAKKEFVLSVVYG